MKHFYDMSEIEKITQNMRIIRSWINCFQKRTSKSNSNLKGSKIQFKSQTYARFKKNMLSINIRYNQSTDIFLEKKLFDIWQHFQLIKRLWHFHYYSKATVSNLSNLSSIGSKKSSFLFVISKVIVPPEKKMINMISISNDTMEVIKAIFLGEKKSLNIIEKKLPNCISIWNTPSARRPCFVLIDVNKSGKAWSIPERLRLCMPTS